MGVIIGIKIGDILEVKTSKGFAYIQYTHEDPVYGEIVRVLEGIFKDAQHPDQLCILAQNPHVFVAIIPLAAVVKKKIFQVVARCDVPAFASQYPTFRTAKGAYKRYVLYDGNKKWRKEDLSSEEKAFPVLGIWNDTLLVERIAENWRPDDEFREG